MSGRSALAHAALQIEWRLRKVRHLRPNSAEAGEDNRASSWNIWIRMLFPRYETTGACKSSIIVYGTFQEWATALHHKSICLRYHRPPNQ
jgi:hypothetical protein